MKSLSAVLMLLLVVVTNEAWGQQRFELIDATGVIDGAVEVAQGRLILFERSTERTYYSRNVRFDSADGRFVGYFNQVLNRVLRFPRSGAGVMQTADLNEPTPRFRNTVKRVRPIGARVPAAWQAPSGIAVVPSVPSWDPFDPYATGYRGVGPPTQSLLIDSKTIANPPLPPARVRLINDGPREIQVAVVDFTNPGAAVSMRIQPAAFAEVDLERDSGSKKISHYRVITPLGESVTQEFVSEIPPAVRYEVVVHEWAVQSVAIDRTGKSPNTIEDVNFQGRGIGRFVLPPGPELQSGNVEVYRAARSRGNAGSVAPIFPADSTVDSTSPLERAIFEAQRAAQQR